MKLRKLNTILAFTLAASSTVVVAQEVSGSQSEMSDYNAVIEKYDVNNNGELDKNELQNYMMEKQPEAAARNGDKVSVTQRPAIVTINQKPAQITVRQPKPEVSITTNDPDISIEQPEPKVTVSQAQPKVNVKSGKPAVDVRQEDPDVAISQPDPTVNIEREDVVVDVNDK
ncbi:DUF6470 family protein [Alteromonas sp. CI.11.F.A3]|uniref:DUF6470 family protein n=1 Tax=Alteromonas sp. CI.11.F.A3 TaxID=3079555 RepID=UPI002942159F|nr:DUF6470 family protein [Alteromonas sp. CI.11.F.A3]WOI36789.1 DUF6470 family protein [Alteromonas sp. CI.11.F.A3]